MNKRTLPVVLVMLLWIAFTATLSAQSQQGSVVGTITDSSGAAIPSATLVLKNDQTNVTQTATADSSGNYRFTLVPPGLYTLSVKAQGFTEKQIKNVQVETSKAQELNTALSVQTASTTIEVQEQESLVQTATSEISNTVNQRTVDSLPLPTRNIFNLAFLAPQVSTGMNGNATAGGLREASTSYLLNGAENNYNFSAGGYNVTPPLESVGEFTIVTNSMSAQYGRGAGAIISASQKSGTNQIHGAAYEFNRNRVFRANDFFSNRNGADKPQFNRNQFGGAVGGPIIKDKTFWYFAYDRIDLRTSGNALFQVPTSNELAAIQAQIGPVGKGILSVIAPLTSNTVCPNSPSAAIGHVGCINIADPNPTKINTYYGRFDHNFSAKDRLSLSINIGTYSSPDTYGGGNPTAQGPIQSVYEAPNHNLSLNETHMFSAKAINELTISNIRHINQTISGTEKTNNVPGINVDGVSYGGFGYSFGGYEGNTNSFNEGRWNLVDNFSYTSGKHNIKFGGSYQLGNLYRNWDLGSPGYYTFANAFGSSVAVNSNGTIGPYDDYTVSNLVKDAPYFMETSIDPTTGNKANAYRHYIYHDAALFVQDDFRVSRRLTVNLGLRWERFQAPTENHGVIAQFTNWFGSLNPADIAQAKAVPVTSMWHTRNKDFGPRIGFAYDVFGNGKMSVRGGYGISYDRIFDNVWSNGAWNPPFYGLADLDASGANQVYYSNPIATGKAYVPNSLPSAAVPLSLRTMEQYLKDSSGQNLFLSVERQLSKDYLVRVNYQASLGRHLPVLMNINRFDGMRYNATLSAVLRPQPIYNGFNYRSNITSSNYNALIVEVQKRFSNGLQGQFSYNRSKLLDYGSELFQGETAYGSSSQPYYFISNLINRKYEYGRGAYDHTNGIKVSFVYEVPFFKNSNAITKGVLGGWTATSFYQGYSGHPLTIYASRSARAGNGIDPNGKRENIGGDYNLDQVNNDRPDFIGNAGSFYSGNNPADGIFKDNRPIGCGYAGMTSTNAVTTCASVYGITNPNASFVNPAGYGVRYGNLGRNVFIGPWFHGLNSSIHKNFSLEKLRGGMKLQIRAEAINALNHANFDAINTNVASASSFGKATTLAGNDGTENGISRRFQFGARITF